jgi:hypothetical protein
MAMTDEEFERIQERLSVILDPAGMVVYAAEQVAQQEAARARAEHPDPVKDVRAVCRLIMSRPWYS